MIFPSLRASLTTLPKYSTSKRRYLQQLNNKRSNFRIAGQKDQRVMTRKVVVAASLRIIAMQAVCSLPIRRPRKGPTRNAASSLTVIMANNRTQRRHSPRQPNTLITLASSATNMVIAITTFTGATHLANQITMPSLQQVATSLHHRSTNNSRATSNRGRSSRPTTLRQTLLLIIITRGAATIISINNSTIDAHTSLP